MKITKILIGLLIGLLIFWLINASIFFSQKFTLDERNEFEIDYSKFREHLENKEIEKAFIEDKEFHGELHVEAIDKEKDVRYSRFKTTLPEAPDDETAGKWSGEYNVVLEFKAISNEWWNYISTFTVDSFRLSSCDSCWPNLNLNSTAKKEIKPKSSSKKV